MKLLQNKPIIIIGAGGHAKVLVSSLKKQDKNIIGLVDKKIKATKILGIPMLGDDTVLAQYYNNEVVLVNGIGMLPKNNLRKKIYIDYKSKDYMFIQVIDSNALLTEEISLGEGVQIMAGCVIQPCVSIGNNTIINTRTSVDHDCVIGNNCHIAPGVTLGGNVKVGDNVFIGAGSAVINNIEIASNSIIAAGVCVFKSVGFGALVYR